MNFSSSFRAILLLAVWLGVVTADAAANDPPDARAWAALREPGTIVLMRHALAPGTGDPENLKLDDCATQRNLSEDGRRQARAAGDALRAHGITEAKIYSSQWCRCLETARLLNLGPVEPLPALNNLYGRPERTAPQMAELRAFIKTAAKQAAMKGKVVMSTHNVVIAALVGVSTGSAEMVVVRIGGDDSLTVIGRIRPPS